MFNSRRQQGFQKLIVIGLIAIALVVFLLLPQLVSEPWLAPEELTPVAENNTTPAELTLSTQAKKTKYRQDAQFILAKILLLKEQLEKQQASKWASFDFNKALNNIDKGDEEYARAEYEQSINNYQAALDGLESLTKTAEEKLQQAIIDGETAIQLGKVKEATNAVDLAMTIAAENESVKVLQQRLKVLPELVGLLQRAKTFRQGGDLLQAQQAYQKATAVDPLHKQSQSALENINLEIIDKQFNDAMSAGYRALNTDQFEQAEIAFQQAAGIYANNSAVKQAKAQLESRKSQLWADRQLSKAKIFEQQEEWQQAVAVYEKMLLVDPSLGDVVVKKIPATVRADLDKQLKKTLLDPLKLSFKSNYNAAEQLLMDAKSIKHPGDKLKRQISELKKILTLSQVPVEVAFVSDALTDVKLFRVASLGAFEKKTLTLKSGSYTVAGSRKGFRDVRVDFVVNGEPLSQPIVVRCTEPI